MAVITGMEHIFIFTRYVNLEVYKFHKDFLQFDSTTDLINKMLPLILGNFIQ